MSAALTFSILGGGVSYAAETETPPVTVTEETEPPEACRLPADEDADDVMTTGSVEMIQAEMDEASDEDSEEGEGAERMHDGSAMRTCVHALQEAGEHAFGQSVSAFAHALNDARETERDERKAERKQGSAAVEPTTTTATASATTTSTATVAIATATGTTAEDSTTANTGGATETRKAEGKPAKDKSADDGKSKGGNWKP